jgi:Ca2+-binding EF-hand superfamily protein
MKEGLMSSVSSASSSNVAYYASQRNSLFNKLDSNQDGSLSEDEFVAGRPKDVSESQAAKYYSKLDTSGTASLTEDEFDQGTDQNQQSFGGIQSLLSGNAMAVLMLMSPQGGMQFSSDTGDSSGYGQQPSAADMYSSMDTDGDGSVSKVEFLAARPDDMSEDDATKVYDKIDTTGTGSITEEQFADSMKNMAAQRQGGMPLAPPPQDSSSGSSQSPDEVFDSLDTNKDGSVSEAEFLAGRPDDVTDDQASNLFDSIDTEGTGSITNDQFDSYVSNALGQDQTDTTAAGTDDGSLADLTDLAGAFSFDPSKGIGDLLTMLDSMSSDSASATEAA